MATKTPLDWKNLFESEEFHREFYYDGPLGPEYAPAATTLRLWAPGAQHELAAGGRYDGLFPELGRPWFAAGFCVRLTRLLDLAETRPEFVETL